MCWVRRGQSRADNWGCKGKGAWAQVCVYQNQGSLTGYKITGKKKYKSTCANTTAIKPRVAHLMQDTCKMKIAKCKQNYKKDKKIWGGQKCLSSTILQKVVLSPDAESTNR